MGRADDWINSCHPISSEKRTRSLDAVLKARSEMMAKSEKVRRDKAEIDIARAQVAKERGDRTARAKKLVGTGSTTDEERVAKSRL